MKIAICDDSIECNGKMNEMLMKYLRKNDIERYEITVYLSGSHLIDDFSQSKYDLIF